MYVSDLLGCSQTNHRRVVIGSILPYRLQHLLHQKIHIILRLIRMNNGRSQSITSFCLSLMVPIMGFQNIVQKVDVIWLSKAGQKNNLISWNLLFF